MENGNGGITGGDRSGGEPGGAPALDVSRPAAELKDRELDALLAEWIGWTIWRNPLSARKSAVWAYKPGTDVSASPTMGAAPAATLKAQHVPGSIPRYSSTHDSAAALRAHVRSLGLHAVYAYTGAVFAVTASSEGTTEEAEFAMMDATPRQQAEAAYEAFVRTPVPAAPST